jgi:hypothetical protein
MCIRYLGNVSTEPLPSNDNGIFTEPLPSNDNGIFTEPLPSNDRGDTHTHTYTATWSHKPALFFQNKESRLEITYNTKICKFECTSHLGPNFISKHFQFVVFEVLKAVIISSSSFWDVTPCDVVVEHTFVGMYCLHPLGLRVNEAGNQRESACSLFA